MAKIETERILSELEQKAYDLIEKLGTVIIAEMGNMAGALGRLKQHNLIEIYKDSKLKAKVVTLKKEVLSVEDQGKECCKEKETLKPIDKPLRYPMSNYKVEAIVDDLTNVSQETADNITKHREKIENILEGKDD